METQSTIHIHFILMYSMLSITYENIISEKFCEC